MEMVQLPIVSLLISLLLVILFFTKKHIYNEETHIYKRMVLINYFFSLFSLIIVMLASGNVGNAYIAILQKLYLICMLILVVLIFLYNLSISNLTTRKQNRGIFIINVILMLPILFSKMTVINNGEVLDGYGPAYNIFLGLLVIYFVLILINIFYILFKTKVSFRKDIPFVVLVILFIAGFIIRKYCPNIIFETFFFSFMMLIMYHTIENPDVKLINQLELAKTTAEKANRAKSEFLSSMSHEIRTPLNAIVNLSKIIQNTDDLVEIKEDAKDVVVASQNLLEIVNGILDISKIEANKMELVETIYEPIKIFNEIKTVIVPRIGEKDIELRCNFAPDIPATLKGDKNKIKQIITNILTNAVKYTEKGHIDFDVKCINEKNLSRLQIIISDTGRGIKPEQLDKLFTKFNRLEEDRNTTVEGTGLGLAITKALVEMMGGKIIVHSVYNEGSKFTVFIPQEITNETIKEEKVELKSDTYPNKKILIVDDNMLNLKVATKVLMPFKVNVDTCQSGFECIDKIKSDSKYDIILMDIMMPKMNGTKTLKELLKIEGFNTPVIALTADAMEGKAKVYIDEGFNDYLSKPINLEELKVILSKYLN